jgi:hypothetical protein
MDFEKKFDFFKTRKISYMGPLGSTDPKYESHDQEIQSFGPFVP